MKFPFPVIILATCLTVFLSGHVDGGRIKSELRTKQLLQNIRSHLAQQVDEVVKEKECDTGLTLCPPSKSKEEEEEEELPLESEEVLPAPKIRGHHKPVIKVNPKDVIQTMIHAHKHVKKIEKDTDQGKDDKAKKDKEESEEDKEDDEEEDGDDDDDEDGKDKKDVKPEKKAKKKKPKKSEKPGKMEENEGVEFPEDLPVFAATSNLVETPLCRKHSRVFLRQLKRYKLWALMMYDASAKLPTGILQGNINQYGDFDQCLSINAMFKNPKTKKISTETPGIQGKYCLANIDVTAVDPDIGLRQAVHRSQAFAFVRSKLDDPGHFIPRFTTINWGLCVPSACEAEDVERTLEMGLSYYNESSGLTFDVKVRDGNCMAREDTQLQFSTMALLTVIFYGSVIGASAYATYKDLHVGETSEEAAEDEVDGTEQEKEADEGSKEEEEPQRKASSASKAESKEEGEKAGEGEEDTEKKLLTEMSEPSQKGKLARILMAFSLKRNVEELLKETEGDNEISCIHGIKAVFTFMLYFAHKTIPLALTPFTNRILLTQTSNEPGSVLLRASIIYTDSFLLLSGVLTSYNLCQEIHDKGRIAWFRRSIARYIRLTPALLATVLFYAYVADHLGSGPMWNETIHENAVLCQNYMWRNLFYVQNIFSFETMCAPQTHQLALDMQLSLLSPFLVYLLYRYDKIGVGILQGIFVISSILRYISTSNNNLSLIIYHGMTVSQLYRTANLLYSQTLHRASPYVLGVLIGYYLKKRGGSLDFPKPFVAIGWIAASCFGFLAIATPSHLADRAYQYDVYEAAQYAALSPIAWSLALGWAIAACHLGYGGRVNEILCNRVLIIVSRISYSVYLTQFLVFFYRVGTQRVPDTFSISGSFNTTEFVGIVGISIVLTLLFDLPMKEIKSILLERSIEEVPEAAAEGEEGAQGNGEGDEDVPEETIPEEGEFLPESEEGESEMGPEEGEEEEEEMEVDYPPQPLKRVSRIHFDEDAEDMEFWENENRELERQKREAKAGAGDFWGKDED